MNKIIFLALTSLILNGCSQAVTTQPPIPKVVELPKVNSKPVTMKAIDWSKIDKPNNLIVDNFPKEVIQRYQIDDVMMQAVMSDSKVSKEQAMRILAMQGGVQDEGVLQGLFDQLGDDLVGASWGFATSDQKGIRKADKPVSDEEAVRDYRLFIMTKPNVKAEIHHYVFTSSDAKDFSLLIQILPTNNRSADESAAIYSDQKVSEEITSLIRNKYRGELQAIGYKPDNQTTNVTIFFPEGDPSQATLDKLEAELESLTSLDISIEILAGRMIF
ncbi:hypothetical protein [uncultured Psychrobacter sp.]|uniref:hypothetical protein n=1 Tax=uncultured Psychrobacter sp. TaxID=259303 RepID=UPI002591F93E|nr:hypothetical protein [uncultured Psychrobacter sp.]